MRSFVSRRKFFATAGLFGGSALLTRRDRNSTLPEEQMGNGQLGIPVPYLFTDLKSRSISPENPKGLEGSANKDKISGSITIPVGTNQTIADINGPGMIRHIWLTFPNRSPEALRSHVIRIYWDHMDYPSVEAPLGDFFGLGHGRASHFSTPYLGVSDSRGFNCFFPMPFLKHCRITIENGLPDLLGGFFYHIDYTLGDKITDNVGRFHAHFRRDRPAKGKNFLVLDTKGTPGIYVGTVIGCLPLEPGTWREGEFRFFLDGDKELATIAGTGWSDWFLSAWGLDLNQSLYGGSTYQVKHPDFGDKYFCSCFRFHVLDPIYFQEELRVEHQQLGRMIEGKWSQRADDWFSVAYWYQRLTGERLPPIPDQKERIRDIAKLPWEEEALRKMYDGTGRVMG